MNACSRLVCLGLVSSVAAATAACGTDSPTSPTTTTTTTATQIAADASNVEAFRGTLPVNGFRFYSFQVGAYGTVTITVDSAGGGNGVPDGVEVGVGLGVPDGTDCRTTVSLTTEPGAGPHISSTLAAGTYCARVSDIGNLNAAAPFAVTIAHP